MNQPSLSLRALAGLLLGALAPAVAPGLLPAQQVVQIPAGDRVLQPRIAPVFSVGREDGADWETFSGVRQVAFDDADNLYVLDKGSASIYVFRPNGRFLRQIGKKAGGPGELLNPLQFAVTRDGMVVVSDLGRRAFSVFGVDGSFKRNVPYEGQGGLSLSGLRMRAGPRGGVFLTSQGLPGLSPAAGGVGIVRQQFDGRSAPARIFQAPADPSPGGARRTGGATVVSNQRPAFSPEVSWGVLPDGGIAVAYTADYAVRIVSPAGAVTRVVRRGIAPRRVTEADRTAMRERRTAQMAGGGNVTVVGGSSNPQVQALVREALASTVRDMEFADVVPVIQTIATDRAGTVWIQRSGRQVGASGPIDLVTPAGRYVGTLAGQRVPDAFSPTGRVAYIEKDDMEVERVVVRQLPPRW
ncbi:MAG TPA: 6-bladed beta-propeller [Longimicrobiaceae bacterium]